MASCACEVCRAPRGGRQPARRSPRGLTPAREGLVCCNLVLQADTREMGRSRTAAGTATPLMACARESASSAPLGARWPRRRRHEPAHVVVARPRGASLLALALCARPVDGFGSLQYLRSDNGLGPTHGTYRAPERAPPPEHYAVGEASRKPAVGGGEFLSYNRGEVQVRIDEETGQLDIRNMRLRSPPPPPPPPQMGRPPSHSTFGAPQLWRQLSAG